MNDNELLEMAAKAAGITGWQSKHGYWNMKDFNGEDVVCCNNWPNFDPDTGRKLDPTFADAVTELNWRPLTDDGDALRLAVALRIEIEPWIHGDSACARTAVGEVLIDEPHYGDDPERATRRAIVRAAAEIGRKSPTLAN